MPNDGKVIWSEELERLGGAATTLQLRRAGATDRDLAAAVASGRIQRVRNGRYVAPGAPDATRRATALGARLSCASAARSYGLWGGTDTRTHFFIPPNAGRTGAPCSQEVRHWRATEDHPECWRVSLRDCLRSVVRCADGETAVAVLDTALSAGYVTPSAIERIFAGEPRRSRLVAARAVPGSESGVESILRQRLTARGHRVEQQLAVPGVGRVDARVDGVLFVEVDGYEFHSDRTAFERDRVRDTGFALIGARRVRFAARQVIRDPDDVVAAVEGVLAALKREEERYAKTA